MLELNQLLTKLLLFIYEGIIALFASLKRRGKHLVGFFKINQLEGCLVG